VTDPDPPNTASQDVDHSRHSGRVRIATNKQFSDYESYVTADEEEHTMLTTVDEHTDDDVVDNDGLAAVAHYIMVTMLRRRTSKSVKKSTSPRWVNFS
jgi:hypothetical protein